MDIGLKLMNHILAQPLAAVLERRILPQFQALDALPASTGSSSLIGANREERLS